MVVGFFHDAVSLKGVPRQGWIDKGITDKPESVADHSYMTGIISMTVSDMLGLDTAKVVRMSLLHDLAESRIGDIVPGSMPDPEKTVLENRAMEDILGKLPARVRDAYRALWKEFQDAESDEAIMAHDADKLEMALQAKIYAMATGTAGAGIFYESARRSIRGREMQRILESMLAQ